MLNQQTTKLDIKANTRLINSILENASIKKVCLRITIYALFNKEKIFSEKQNNNDVLNQLNTEQLKMLEKILKKINPKTDIKDPTTDKPYLGNVIEYFGYQLWCSTENIEKGVSQSRTFYLINNQTRQVIILFSGPSLHNTEAHKKNLYAPFERAKEYITWLDKDIIESNISTSFEKQTINTTISENKKDRLITLLNFLETMPEKSCFEDMNEFVKLLNKVPNRIGLSHKQDKIYLSFYKKNGEIESRSLQKLSKQTANEFLKKLLVVAGDNINEETLISFLIHSIACYPSAIFKFLQNLDVEKIKHSINAICLAYISCDLSTEDLQMLIDYVVKQKLCLNLSKQTVELCCNKILCQLKLSDEFFSNNNWNFIKQAISQKKCGVYFIELFLKELFKVKINDMDIFEGVLSVLPINILPDFLTGLFSKIKNENSEVKSSLKCLIETSLENYTELFKSDLLVNLFSKQKYKNIIEKLELEKFFIVIKNKTDSTNLIENDSRYKNKKIYDNITIEDKIKNFSNETKEFWRFYKSENCIGLSRATFSGGYLHRGSVSNERAFSSNFPKVDYFLDSTSDFKEICNTKKQFVADAISKTISTLPDFEELDENKKEKIKLMLSDSSNGENLLALFVGSGKRKHSEYAMKFLNPILTEDGKIFSLIIYNSIVNGDLSGLELALRHGFELNNFNYELINKVFVRKNKGSFLCLVMDSFLYYPRKNVVRCVKKLFDMLQHYAVDLNQTFEIVDIKRYQNANLNILAYLFFEKYIQLIKRVSFFISPTSLSKIFKLLIEKGVSIDVCVYNIKGVNFNLFDLALTLNKYFPFPENKVDFYDILNKSGAKHENYFIPFHFLKQTGISSWAVQLKTEIETNVGKVLMEIKGLFKKRTIELTEDFKNRIANYVIAKNKKLISEIKQDGSNKEEKISLINKSMTDMINIIEGKSTLSFNIDMLCDFYKDDFVCLENSESYYIHTPNDLYSDVDEKIQGLFSECRKNSGKKTMDLFINKMLADEKICYDFGVVGILHFVLLELKNKLKQEEKKSAAVNFNYIIKALVEKNKINLNVSLPNIGSLIDIAYRYKMYDILLYLVENKVSLFERIDWSDSLSCLVSNGAKIISGELGNDGNVNYLKNIIEGRDDCHLDVLNYKLAGHFGYYCGKSFDGLDTDEKYKIRKESYRYSFFNLILVNKEFDLVKNVVTSCIEKNLQLPQIWFALANYQSMCYSVSQENPLMEQTFREVSRKLFENTDLDTCKNLKTAFETDDYYHIAQLIFIANFSDRATKSNNATLALLEQFKDINVNTELFKVATTLIARITKVKNNEFFDLSFCPSRPSCQYDL